MVGNMDSFNIYDVNHNSLVKMVAAYYIVVNEVGLNVDLSKCYYTQNTRLGNTLKEIPASYEYIRKFAYDIATTDGAANIYNISPELMEKYKSLATDSDQKSE